MNSSKSVPHSNGKKHADRSCSISIRFCELGSKKPVFNVGKCKQINLDGIAITSLLPLTPKRLVIVETELKNLDGIPAKPILTLSQNRILTEVTWRHLNLETGLFEAGLKFIDAEKGEEFEPVLAQCLPEFKQIPA